MHGGERVLEALCRLYPEADLFTNVYVRSAVSPIIKARRVRTTFIQRLPFSSRLYKAYIPLMPAALERLDLRGYSLVISSESGPAKNVIVDPDALHICYCHSPMRYLWDQAREYEEGAGFLARTAMGFLTHRMRLSDVTSAARVDQFVANSRFVASRIRKYWRRDSIVVPPPVDTYRFSVSRSHDGFYLWLGRLVRYKRPDLAVDAFTRSGKPLVIAGNGPELAKLHAYAGRNVTFIENVSDEKVKSLMERCRAFLLTGIEDFGIAPVEAMACGKPVLAYFRGGAQDTVSEGVSGLFFHEASPEALIDVVERFEASPERFEPSVIREWAETFGEKQFQAKMRGVVDASVRNAAERPARTT